MPWTWLFVGLSLGVLLGLPVAGVWSRRTERRVRQLEQRTRAAERLAELGTMTGGLAHEIKNPLSTLGLNIQLIQEDLEELATGEADPSAREQLGRTRRRVEGLQREATRLRGILEDFLRFAGRVKLDRAPTDLNALCEELVDFFQPQADEAQVRLRCDLQANPAVADVDGGLLKQALLNLLINACQAMTEARKKQTLSGGNADLMLRSENVRLSAKPGRRGDAAVDAIALQVTDTGPGIGDAALQRIFEPYFSTKRGGTGLGLPTTRRLVEEHGGSLTVHTAAGQGTRFTITLPMRTPSDNSRRPTAAGT